MKFLNLSCLLSGLLCTSCLFSDDERSSVPRVIEDTSWMEDSDNPYVQIMEFANKKEFVYDAMQKFYLWSKEVPNLNPNYLVDEYDVLNETKYEILDRWSFIISFEEYNTAFVESKNENFGFYLSSHADGYFLGMTLGGSPARAAGLRRGDQIISINGKDPATMLDTDISKEIAKQSLELEYVRSGGTPQTVQLAKTEYVENPVTQDTVLNHAGKKVAYFQYSSFLSSSYDPLKDVFDSFYKQGADELVIDLRYNSGGLVDIVWLIAEYIMDVPGDSVLGGEFIVNDFLTAVTNPEDNRFYYYPNPNSLKLDRVFFLVSKYSASASELLINSLEPYIDVHLIGSRTHGKPTGMASLEYDKDFVLFPIMFKTANAEGFSDYFDGLPVDVQEIDDVRFPFGSKEEPMLAHALKFVESGSFSATLNKTSSENDAIFLNSLRKEWMKNSIIPRP